MSFDSDISLHSAVLAVDVLAAAVWLGGVAIADAFASRVRARRNDAAIVEFIVDYGRITLGLLIPAALVAAVAAGWLAQDDGRSIHDDWWLPASAALWFVAVVGSLAVRPLAARQVGAYAERDGTDAEDVQWRARRVLLLARGELLVAAVAIALQTIKPG